MILTFDVEIPLRWKSNNGNAVPAGNGIRREFSSNRYRKNARHLMSFSWDFFPCINSWCLLHLHLNIQPLKLFPSPDFSNRSLIPVVDFSCFPFPSFLRIFFNGVNDLKMEKAKKKPGTGMVLVLTRRSHP